AILGDNRDNLLTHARANAARLRTELALARRETTTGSPPALASSGRSCAASGRFRKPVAAGVDKRNRSSRLRKVPGAGRGERIGGTGCLVIGVEKQMGVLPEQVLIQLLVLLNDQAKIEFSLHSNAARLSHASA